MEKRVEWSGTRWVGMVESEEKAGPRQRTEKKNQMSKLVMAILGRQRQDCPASQDYTVRSSFKKQIKSEV